MAKVLGLKMLKNYQESHQTQLFHEEKNRYDRLEIEIQCICEKLQAY